MQLTNLYVTLSSIMPKIEQTDTHFNHVPACLISVFIQFLFALPLLYQCKYTLKYNEEAQQDCCYNVGPGADQFSIGFNQSRNRTIDQYTKQGTKYISYTTGKKCTTDDCGGNSVHFKAGCLGGGTCHGIQAVADSADGSKETGKNICLHLCFLNIKSHQGCRLLIATYCVNTAAEACVFQHQINSKNYDQCNYNSYTKVWKLHDSLFVQIPSKWKGKS